VSNNIFFDHLYGFWESIFTDFEKVIFNKVNDSRMFLSDWRWLTEQWKHESYSEWKFIHPKTNKMKLALFQISFQNSLNRSLETITVWRILALSSSQKNFHLNFVRFSDSSKFSNSVRQPVKSKYEKEFQTKLCFQLT